MRKSNIEVRKLILIGVLSALVFALSAIQIRIPIADGTRVHFGNIMCLLSGVLFGPFVGGLASGLGSMIYDLSDPLYFSEFWITFLMKFSMGFLAGWYAKSVPKKLSNTLHVFFAALIGQISYILLYSIKTAIFQHYVFGNPWVAVYGVVFAKTVISIFNGAIAVICCVLLAPALANALKKSGFNL